MTRVPQQFVSTRVSGRPASGGPSDVAVRPLALSGVAAATRVTGVSTRLPCQGAEAERTQAIRVRPGATSPAAPAGTGPAVRPVTHISATLKERAA